MIKYFKYEHIDKEKWDECISRSFNGVIYAYSWFLDVVCEEWEALVEGDYERVFPINFKKKTGINIIFQPFFTQQLGVFSRTELNPEIINSFLKAIPRKYRVIDLNLNIHNKPDLPDFEYTPQLNHELDLIGDYAGLRKNYSTNTRRNLVKAESEGLSVVKGIKPDDVIELFRANRGKDIKVQTKNLSLSSSKISKVAMPQFVDWGEIIEWQLLENVPGRFPYTAGVYPFKRKGEDPTRMFAGEGPPERTNKRFHYLAEDQKYARLSTAFDSVTLYGEDPARRPDIFGKVGNSGVSISTLDDAKKLY